MLQILIMFVVYHVWGHYYYWRALQRLGIRTVCVCRQGPVASLCPGPVAMIIRLWVSTVCFAFRWYFRLEVLWWYENSTWQWLQITLVPPSGRTLKWKWPCKSSIPFSVCMFIHQFFSFPVLQQSATYFYKIKAYVQQTFTIIKEIIKQWWGQNCPKLSISKHAGDSVKETSAPRGCYAVTQPFVCSSLVIQHTIKN